MKLEWSAVFEIALGVFLAGVLLVVIHGLFAKFLAIHGEKIHGVADKSAIATS